MSYQVTLNSRNVLIPIALENTEGARMHAPLSPLDTATAMAIFIAADGGMRQEFIPLAIVRDVDRAYVGSAWELRSQATGSGRSVYYLGVPDGCFAPGKDVPDPKTLSIQVVGSSPLTGKEDFSGGLDVSLQAQVDLPLIPGFLNLGERFFPTLLPPNFIESYVLDTFEFRGRRRPLLLAALQTDASDRIPVSLDKHWDAGNWIQAVVENLAPAGGGTYFTIAGGCFFSRNGKITHWFGGRIGPEEKEFREAAADKIRALGGSGNGAWVFWLEAQGANPPAWETLAVFGKREFQPHFSIRHPVMHQLLHHREGSGAMGRLQSQLSIARLSVAEAISALSQVARILVDHQEDLQKARTEPSHALWSEFVAHPGRDNPARPDGSGLESTVRALYRDRGEVLRTLESVFDETYGYAAWDAVGGPLREALSSYLAEAESGTRSPS